MKFGKIIICLLMIIVLSMTSFLSVSAEYITEDENTTTVCDMEGCIQITKNEGNKENIIPKLILNGVGGLVSLSLGIF